mmetsp:Transcript_15436/g.49911  ORF Transcript_15436/g.49911 Transcript_15436/m.49911 type:complete len:336 (+) Transcript_15436:144-1151(+)
MQGGLARPRDRLVRVEQGPHMRTRVLAALVVPDVARRVAVREQVRGGPGAAPLVPAGRGRAEGRGLAAADVGGLARLVVQDRAGGLAKGGGALGAHAARGGRTAHRGGRRCEVEESAVRGAAWAVGVRKRAARRSVGGGAFLLCEVGGAEQVLGRLEALVGGVDGLDARAVVDGGVGRAVHHLGQPCRHRALEQAAVLRAFRGERGARQRPRHKRGRHRPGEVHGLAVPRVDVHGRDLELGGRVDDERVPRCEAVQRLAELAAVPGRQGGVRGVASHRPLRPLHDVLRLVPRQLRAAAGATASEIRGGRVVWAGEGDLAHTRLGADQPAVPVVVV